jgi:hypothetical protein
VSIKLRSLKTPTSTFKSPDKVVDVHGDTTQKAKMLEIMIANSVDMDQSEEISNVEGCEPMTWKPMVL